jgi:hypothetical protein
VTRTRDLLITNFLHPIKTLGNPTISKAQDAKRGNARRGAASRLHPETSTEMATNGGRSEAVTVTAS